MFIDRIPEILSAAIAAAVIAGPAFSFQAQAQTKSDRRLSEPVVHDNLAVYFIHGDNSQGEMPLTLAEALDNGAARVIETGDVNMLSFENLGDKPVFIQAGDMVKGGKQDRVLTMSLLVPPGAKDVPIAAFCVEQGRWEARGNEDVMKFTSSLQAMPLRAAKLAMHAPRKAHSVPTGEMQSSGAIPTPRQLRQRFSLSSDSLNRADPGASETSRRQRAVWDEVAKAQRKLSANVAGSVADHKSETSLQLSLENEKLETARKAYMAKLEKAGDDKDDIVGVVIAINGKLNSADVYPHHGLFKKMWPKLIEAAVTEAIAEDGSKGDGNPQPTVADVGDFLDELEKGERHERNVAELMEITTHDAPKGLYTEARAAKGDWVHRRYVAK